MSNFILKYSRRFSLIRISVSISNIYLYKIWTFLSTFQIFYNPCSLFRKKISNMQLHILFINKQFYLPNMYMYEYRWRSKYMYITCFLQFISEVSRKVIEVKLHLYLSSMWQIKKRKDTMKKYK